MPIEQASILNPVKSGIRYDHSFEHWKAVVHCNGSLDELLRWDNGYYPKWFMAKVVAFYRSDVSVEVHSNDAVNRVIKANSKKRR